MMYKRNDLEHIITLEPAWDKRSDVPSKNYGVHGVTLRMVVKGPLGATQFLLYTNWQLPHVTKEQLDNPRWPLDKTAVRAVWQPLAADVGYHSPKPMYEDHSPMSGECEYVPGGVCYYDGSGLRAQEWYEQKLLPGGSDAIWEALEEEYEDRFERADDGAHEA